jgi:hypothetical protein
MGHDGTRKKINRAGEDQQQIIWPDLKLNCRQSVGGRSRWLAVFCFIYSSR